MDDASDADDFSGTTCRLSHEHIAGALDYRGECLHYVAHIVRDGEAVLSVDVDSEAASIRDPSRHEVIERVARDALDRLNARLVGEPLLVMSITARLN